MVRGKIGPMFLLRRMSSSTRVASLSKQDWTASIVLANGGVFLLWNMMATPWEVDFMIKHFSLSLESFYKGRIWTLFSSCFSHPTATHLWVNMLYLSVLGLSTRNLLSSRQFIQFYSLACLGSSSAYLIDAKLFHPNAPPSLGASGCAFAMASFYACHNPHLLWFVAGSLVLVPIALKDRSISHSSHLGGAVTGIVYFMLTKRLF